MRHLTMIGLALALGSALAGQESLPSGNGTQPPVMAPDKAPVTIPEPAGRIGRITIEIIEVYDPAVPKESGRFGRLVNALHYRTRERVVRRELLFAEGEPLDPDKLAQSERNLRALGFFISATVTAGKPEDGPKERGNVPVHVRVQDAWSLQVGGKFRHEGGFSSYAFGVEEENLLGLGIKLNARRKVTFGGAETEFTFNDTRFLGSREQLGLSYVGLREGRRRSIFLNRPFFSIDTAWGHQFFMQEIRDRLKIYAAGVVTHEYASLAEDGVASYSRAVGHPQPGAVWRLGAGYQYQRRAYSLLPAPAPGDAKLLPESRLSAGPFLEFTYHRDEFVEAVNLLQPRVIEDFNLGLEVNGRVRYSGPGTGGDDKKRLFYSGGLSRGWKLPKGGLMLLDSRLQLELGAGGTPHDRFSMALRGWRPKSAVRVRAALLELRTSVNAKPADYYYLGGSPGLRGYNENQFAGPHSLLVVGEERRYFKWTPFNLVQPGVVGFVEAAAIWGGGIGLSTAALHADVGVGLRFALLKTSGTLLKIDYAVPVGRRPPGSPKSQVIVGFRGDF